AQTFLITRLWSQSERREDGRGEDRFELRATQVAFTFWRWECTLMVDCPFGVLGLRWVEAVTNGEAEPTPGQP
ncbi:MAG: hypothetical protein ACJ78G_05025, partial [Gemmatimonadaceae bacterium]